MTDNQVTEQWKPVIPAEPGRCFTRQCHTLVGKLSGIMSSFRSVFQVRPRFAMVWLSIMAIGLPFPAKAEQVVTSLPATGTASLIGPVETGTSFPVADIQVLSLLHSLMEAVGQELDPDGRNLSEYVRLAIHALTLRNQVPDIADADPLVTVAASFLHDIGGSGPRGEVAGPPRAREILDKLGGNPQFVDRVCAIVGNHHLSTPLQRDSHYPELWIVVGCDVHSPVRFETRDELFKIVIDRVAAAKARAKWEAMPAKATSTSRPTITHRAAWLAEASYGVMVHYLINPRGDTPTARTENLNRIVNGFDLDHFICQIEASRADWVIFTIGQNTNYYCSPNAYLDQMLPGHTSSRDLPLEIGRRLAAIHKRLIVYLPAEITATSPELQRAFAWNPPDHREYLSRYQKFVRTWSQQYGQYHHGWWFDGCYDHIHQGKWDWSAWGEASRAGNPERIVAFNDGAFCVGRVKPVSPFQDYHAGEVHVLEDGQIRLEWLGGPKLQRTPEGRWRIDGQEPKLYLPDAQFVDGIQWHALVPIDSSFSPAIPNMHYTDAELIRFIQACKAVKGAVTLNVPIAQNGRIPESTAAQLTRIGRAITPEK